jgi:hypothetical protein
MIMELYGSFVLFRSLPTSTQFFIILIFGWYWDLLSFCSGYGAPIQAFIYQIPIIGWILQYPFQVNSSTFVLHICHYT